MGDSKEQLRADIVKLQNDKNPKTLLARARLIKQKNDKLEELESDLVSGRDFHQSNDNTFGFTNEPDGLDTAKKRKDFKNKQNIQAKNGFMGMIDTKTMFTVGEKGKREHVTRKKNNNIFDVGYKF